MVDTVDMDPTAAVGALPRVAVLNPRAAQVRAAAATTGVDIAVDDNGTIVICFIGAGVAV
jgi:hypothetical protein